MPKIPPMSSDNLYREPTNFQCKQAVEPDDSWILSLEDMQAVEPTPELPADLLKKVYKFFIFFCNKDIKHAKAELPHYENNVEHSASCYVKQYELLQCLFRAVFEFLYKDLREVACMENPQVFCVLKFNDDVQFINNTHNSSAILCNKDMLLSNAEEAEAAQNILPSQSNSVVERALLDLALHKHCLKGMMEVSSLLESFIDSYVKKEYSKKEYCPGSGSNLAREFENIINDIGNLAWALRVAIIRDIYFHKDPKGRNGVFNYECTRYEGSLVHVVTLGRNSTAINGGSGKLPEGNIVVGKKTKSQILYSWADALFHAFNHSTKFCLDAALAGDNGVINRQHNRQGKEILENVTPQIQTLQANTFTDDEVVQNNRCSEQQGHDGPVVDYGNVMPANQEVQGHSLPAADQQDEDLDGICIPMQGTQNPEKSLAAAKKFQSKENLRAVALGANIEPIEQDNRSMAVSNYAPNRLINKNNAQFDYRQARPSTQLSALRIICAQSQERPSSTAKFFD